MKKKVVLLVISILFVSILVFLFTTDFLSAAGGAKDGHEVYDENGDYLGCQAPGEACTPDMSLPY